MQDDAFTSNPVSYYFAEMRRSIEEEELRYMFLSVRQYLRERTGIEVVVEIHGRMPAGGAIGALLENGKYYCIFVSRADAEKNPDMLRLRVAHEIGHLIMRHVREGEILYALGLGSSGTADSKYDKWRHLIEDEADIFAFNMFLAQGRVVERRIPSKQDYERNIGDLFVDVRPDHKKRPSILNTEQFRKEVFCALRNAGLLRPALPVLCHSLFDVFGDEVLRVNGGSLHRRDGAENLHRAYRTRLQNPEAKPPIGMCLSCPDSCNQLCFGYI